MNRSGRGYAAHSRVRPHVPIPDDADCCTVCHVRVDVKNALHLDRPPAAVTEHQAVERNRLADHD